MGNACGQKGSADAAADGASGLTKTEKKLVTELWNPIVDKATFKENGTMFFVKLFAKHPYMKEYFPDFRNQQEAELKQNLALRAHGISVFTAITSLVINVDDTETFASLIDKRAISHYKRGVTFEDMENLRLFLVEYVREKSPKNKNLEKSLEAWNKLLIKHNEIYKQKYENLSNESDARLAANTKVSGSTATSQSNTPRATPRN